MAKTWATLALALLGLGAAAPVSAAQPPTWTQPVKPFLAVSGAQTSVWQPSPGHTQIPIWPGAAPDAQSVPGPESHTEGAVTNVTRPTMTVYAPTVKNTGA